jgi:hypothetical protein
MGPVAKSIMSDIMTDKTAVEQVPEVIQKQASGYSPRAIDTLSKKPAAGTLSTREVQAATRATGDIIREARTAVVDAYRQAGQSVQTTYLGIETSGKNTRVKFAVKQSMRDKGIEVSALVTPEGVAPFSVPSHVAAADTSAAVDLFYAQTTSGSYEELGQATNGFEVRQALQKQRVMVAEVQPRHYVLGLLPEDERDLRAISAQILQSIGKTPAVREKQASTVVNPLQSPLERLRLSVDTLGVRLAEADTEIAKVANYDVLAVKDQRKQLYASLNSDLEDVFDMAVHYANNVTQIHPKLKASAREQLMSNAGRQISRWAGQLSELYAKAASLFMTVPLPSASEKAQAILNNLKQPSFTAQRVEAAAAGLDKSAATELDVLHEIKGYVASLKSQIKEHIAEVNPEPYSFEPNFIHSASEKYPLVFFENGGTLRTDEQDIAWQADQNAVKDALSGKEGKTLDEVAVEKGLDKGTVLRAVRALRAKGLLLVDVVKDGDKAGNHICEPGHDLNQPSKFVLVDRTEVTLKDGEVEFKKGANIAQLNANLRRKAQAEGAQPVAESPKGTKHPDMIPVLTCRKCGKQIGVQANDDGSWGAFCPSCKAKEDEDNGTDKKANADCHPDDATVPPVKGMADFEGKSCPCCKGPCKCKPGCKGCNCRKSASNHSNKVITKSGQVKCATSNCGYSYKSVLPFCPKCRLKTAGLVGASKKAQSISMTEAQKPAPPGKVKKITKTDDGTEQVTVMDENLAKQQEQKTASRKRGAALNTSRK